MCNTVKCKVKRCPVDTRLCYTVELGDSAQPKNIIKVYEHITLLKIVNLKIV